MPDVSQQASHRARHARFQALYRALKPCFPR
jgi:hypothetical protein